VEAKLSSSNPPRVMMAPVERPIKASQGRRPWGSVGSADDLPQPEVN